MLATPMQQHDILPPRQSRRVPRTNDSPHKLGNAPNLLASNFKVDTHDTFFLAEVSYVPTDDWLNLAAVKDLAMMEIVGEPKVTFRGLSVNDAWALGAARPSGQGLRERRVPRRP